jgi:hypothetical protein
MLFLFMHTYLLFFFIFLGAGPAQPMALGWAGLDPAGPAWSLAQASDPAGQRHAPRVRAKVN